MSRAGLLLVGHGSRDPATRLEHDALEAKLREEFPDHTVASGFIELSDPPLIDALSQLAHACERVVVVPLLLFTGGHMQRDVPKAIADVQRLCPNTEFAVTAPFGTNPITLQLASARLADAETDVAGTVLLIGRGAAESEARREFQGVLQGLRTQHANRRFEVAYCGVQQPDVPTALRDLAAAGVERVVVLPYLLFTGRLLQSITHAVSQARTEHPNTNFVLSAHLGSDAVGAIADGLQKMSSTVD